jgi:hypothetical protein
VLIILVAVVLISANRKPWSVSASCAMRAIEDNYRSKNCQVVLEGLASAANTRPDLRQSQPADIVVAMITAR